MLYKAIVEKSINEYEAIIRIPSIHRTKSSPEHTPSEQLPVACISSIAGSTSPVQPGDIVIVGLENDDLEKPIILGHLARKNNQHTLGTVSVTSLSASMEAHLPYNTSIGSISGTELSYLSNLAGNIQKQLDLLHEQIESIKRT